MKLAIDLLCGIGHSSKELAICHDVVIAVDCLNVIQLQDFHQNTKDFNNIILIKMPPDQVAKWLRPNSATTIRINTTDENKQRYFKNLYENIGPILVGV